MDSIIELSKSQKLLYALIQRLGTADDKTKLAKLEYFSDFIHFAFHDKPISDPNHIYQRRPFGPLSISFNSDLDQLIKLGLISSDKKYHYSASKNIDLELDAEEEKTIEYVINKYATYPYDVLVDISHKQIPYLSSSEGGLVDYTTAYNLVEEYKDYEG